MTRGLLIASAVALLACVRVRPLEPAIRTGQSATLGGIVKSPDGMPVAGAFVALFDDLAPSGRVVFQTAVTGTDGRFHFDRITQGRWVATATSRTFGPGRSSAISVPADPSKIDGIEIEMTPEAFAIYGTIHDALGTPIAGAMIQTVADYVAGSEFLATLSDDHGNYRLGLGPETYNMKVTAPGFCETRRMVQRSGRIDFRLLRAAKVAGTVRSQLTGKAITHAQVIAAMAWTPTLSAPISVAFSDSSGHFEFESLSPGTYQLRALAGDEIGFASRVMTISTAANAAEATIELSPTGSVSGRVVSPRGKPVAGARVSISEAGLVAAARSGEDGSFTVTGILPGAWDFEIRADNFADSWTHGPEDGRKVMLEVAAEISGTVMDASRKPVFGAVVSLARARGGEFRTWIARTDAEGGYRISALPPGPFVLSARHPTEGVSPAGFSLPTKVRSGDHLTRDVRLMPTAAIYGFVRDSAGDPARGSCVYAFGSSWQNGATVTEDGSYVLSGLAAGHWRLSVDSCEGHRSVFLNFLPSVDIDAGERVRRDLFRDADFPISGRVVARGQALPDVLVDFHGQDPQPLQRTVTAADGTFVVRELPEGASHVLAVLPGFTMRRIEAPADRHAGVAHFSSDEIFGEPVSTAGRGKTFTLEMEPTRSVSGNIIGENHAPVRDATIYVRENDTIRDLERIHGNDGAFICNVPPGEYEIIAQTPDGRVTRLDKVDVRERDVSHLLLPVRPGVTVTGRIVDARTGTPLGASSGSLAAGFTQNLKIASDGTFSVGNMPPGATAHLSILAEGEKEYPFRHYFSVHIAGEHYDVGTLRLLRGARGEKYESGVIGLAAGWSRGSTLVTEIDDGSPAARAGLRIGDEIISIDEFDARGLSRNGIGTLLGGKPGTRVSIVFSRAGAPRRQVEVVREEKR